MYPRGLRTLEHDEKLEGDFSAQTTLALKKIRSKIKIKSFLFFFFALKKK